MIKTNVAPNTSVLVMIRQLFGDSCLGFSQPSFLVSQGLARKIRSLTMALTLSWPKTSHARALPFEPYRKVVFAEPQMRQSVAYWAKSIRRLMLSLTKARSAPIWLGICGFGLGWMSQVTQFCKNNERILFLYVFISPNSLDEFNLGYVCSRINWTDR